VAKGGTNKLAFTDSIPVELKALGDRGKSLVAQGDYAEASEVFDRARQEARARGSRAGEVLFLTYLANTDNTRFRYRSAMEGYLRAKRMASEQGDWRMLVVIESNIAGLYLGQGAIEEASGALRNANAALEKTNDMPQLAAIRLMEAKLRVGEGDTDAAIQLYRQAVGAADRAGDEATLGRALDLLGYQLLESNRLEEAERVMLESFRRRSLIDPPTPDVSYLNLGLLRLRQGNLKEAELLVKHAIRAMGNRPQTIYPWAPYVARARVRMANDDLEGAYRDMQEAMEHVRKLRLAVLPTHSVRAGARAGLNDVLGTFIEVAARLYFASGNIETAKHAFEVSEQQRAIALRESLDDAGELRRRLPPEYWDLLAEANGAEQKLMVAESAEERQRLARLEDRLHELEVEAAIGTDGSRPVLSAAAFQPVPSDAVQRKLKDSEALYGFHLGEHASYLWALTRNGFEFYRLPARRAIGELASSFRSAVQRSSLPETVEYGARLYDALFGQISEEARSKADWLLLAEGELFDLPFAALVHSSQRGGSEFLVERHSVRILPSAAMLLDQPGEVWDGPLVAVGDPIYNAADPRWHPERESDWAQVFPWFPAKPPASGFQLNRLIGSAEEVEESAKAYGRGDAPIMLLGESARSSKLRAALEQHPSVIHLATHVIPAPDHPGQSKIALSMTDSGETELVGEAMVASWETNPALVVMSGCRSGRGSVLPGEGLMGLTRAWLRSGARNVAATLSPTADDGGELLKAMYRHLGDNHAAPLAPARALQMAQIEILRTEQWEARPDRWATFFMVSRE